MTGVEGYVESTASGCGGRRGNGDGRARANRCPILDRLTAIGALATYISDHTVAKFQPMNVNFGIIDAARL